MPSTHRARSTLTAVSIVGAGLLFALTACSGTDTSGEEAGSNDLVPITVASSRTTDVQMFGYAYALAEGIYEDYGLDVTLLPPDKNVSPVQAVAAGTADVGVSDPGPDMTAFTQGLPIRSFAVTLQRAPVAITCRADANVTSVEDLTRDDITVGLKGAPAVDRFNALMTENGVDPAAITSQTIDPTSVAEIIADRVQCMYTTYSFNEPEQIKVAGVDVDIMLEADLGYEAQAGSLVTSVDFYESSPEALTDFYLATRAAWKVMADDPDAAAEWTVKQPDAVGLDLEQQKAVAAGFSALEYNDWTEMEGHGALYPDPSVWMTEAEHLLAAGTISELPDLDTLIVFDIADAANAEEPAPPKPDQYR